MSAKRIDVKLVESISKLNRFYRQERIDFAELAPNLIIRLVGYDYDNIETCLSLLSESDLIRFSDFANSYLKGNDFRPHPGTFMVNTNNPQEVDAKREELQPKYVSLLADIEKAKETLMSRRN